MNEHTHSRSDLVVNAAITGSAAPPRSTCPQMAQF